MGKIYSACSNIFFQIFLLTFLFSHNIQPQVITFSDNWKEPGFTLDAQSSSGVEINFSINEFSINDIEINGVQMKKINLPGVFLPNDEGLPDLPGSGRYIALPQGADASFEIISFRTETYTDIEVSPAPRIPKDTETGPLQYQMDENVYSKNELYPRSPVILSSPQIVRGVDARLIGITPFQYNPVKKELIVYRDLKVRVNFIGGSGYFGEDRFRNRWFEPILQNIFLNYNSLPKINFNNKSDSRTEDYEYIIISPDDPVFLAWADSIKQFRTEQGIRTGIVTTTQAGGNNYTSIENYINNAYNNWDVPPVAVLLLGDYGTTGGTVHTGTWDGYCVSDHLYGDVDGDDMAEIITARITAQNGTQLQVMIGKFLGYERTPPTNPNFYNNPITALGWQTERWFQICSETIAGFWENELGKSPKRENAIYQGTPPFSTWSTATNTGTVLNYFGPNGQGYIPASPSYLTDWGGNATRINNDINSGAFMLQHRDHGGETLWGEPAYNISNINALNNNDLVFVFSLNCLTGKYNYSSTCFAEAFHRHPKGALGLIAASETSYSFVNDAYCWGMYDFMWPDFMPDYGVPGPERILPAFGNVNGKYFLQYSNWPYNTSNKEVTYYLFHHHGDAFSTVYSEMPQVLTVISDPAIVSGLTQYTVTADQYSLIALSLDGEILGVAEGTGTPVAINIPFITPGNNVTLTVTKQNYYRYTSQIPVVPASGPYVVVDSCIINDASGNNNGILDYGETPLLSLRSRNVGVAEATNVTIILRSDDQYATITDSTELYGTIGAGSQLLINDGFSFSLNPLVPDEYLISFNVLATDGVNNWTSNFTLQAHSPELVLGEYTVSDPNPGGNNNQILDPGETAEIVIEVKNTGTSDALNVAGELIVTGSYVTVNSGSQVFGEVAAGGNVTKSFNVTADGGTPSGYSATFNLNITAAQGITGTGNFSICVGQIPALIVCLEDNHSSGPVIRDYLDSCGVAYAYETAMPADLSLYRSIFVCLGIYSNNYELSSAEGTQLAAFLNSGGMVYMEGGDTWFYDDPTPVHSMFNILGQSDGSGDLGTIVGQSGTFASGMSFSYSGENSWIDHITNIAPAQLLFQNQTPNYGVAVSYDATTYKTIGTSFEFGGLSDGTYPSTKKKLMEEIVDFFSLVIPVELTTFEANVDEKGIMLKWETATELNNRGFEVERSADNKSFSKIGYLDGKGTTTESQEYVFRDSDVNGKGKFYYRLKQVDFDGTTAYTEAIEVEYSIVPNVFSLSQNYPNPFNPLTTINFGIPEDVKVTLKIYDILGSEVATIVDDKLDAGYYKYEWNGSGFASGIYIYRMSAGKFVSTKKLMLLK